MNVKARHGQEYASSLLINVKKRRGHFVENVIFLLSNVIAMCMIRMLPIVLFHACELYV